VQGLVIAALGILQQREKRPAPRERVEDALADELRNRLGEAVEAVSGPPQPPSIPEYVDDTRTVLVRSHLRKRRGPTGVGAKRGTSSRWVHSGDDDADMDPSPVCQIAIDQPKDGGVTGLRVDDRLQVRDNRIILLIIRGVVGAGAVRNFTGNLYISSALRQRPYYPCCHFAPAWV
jgi:hypothetical protein